MPVEGQWERQQTPLRRLTRRELRLLQGFVAALVATAIAVAAVAFTHSAPPVPANCIQVTGGSTMGAVNYRVCGADRPAWCRQMARKDDPTARAVAARCRAAGIIPRSARS